MKKQRHILKGLLLASALGCLIPCAEAQTLSSGYGHPATPFQVGNGTQLMKAKILGSGTVCGTGTLDITLPAGYVYEGGASATIYTAGVAGVPVPITPTSSTTGSATLPISGIPAAPDSMIVAFHVSAGCDVIGSSSGSVSYNLSTPGCPITSSSALTGALNAQNAQMNILSVSNSAITNTVGYTYNRVITLQNGGIGYVDTVYLDDLAGSGFHISNVVSSTGTITKTSTVVGTDTLHRYMIVNPTADGHFNEDETFTITEMVEIVGCSGLTSNFTAWYGSNGNACTAVQGASTAGANINNALQPALTIVPNTMNVTTCLGETALHTLKIINTGTSIMRDIHLNLFSGYWTNTTFQSALTSAAQQSGFNPTTFNYQIGTTGVSTPIIMDSTKTFTSPTTSMTAGGYVGNTFFHIPAIVNPGDTVIVTFDEFMPALTGDCNPIEYYHNGIRLNYSYKNGCGMITQVANGQEVKAYRYMHRGLAGQVEVPSDMWPGETYDLTFDKIVAQFAETNIASAAYLPGSEYVFTFTFPSKSIFSGSVSDFIATRDNGTSIPDPSSFVYNAATGTLVVKYDLGSTGISGSTFIRANFRLNGLATDCSNTGTNNTFSFKVGYTLAGCTTPFNGTCYSTPVLVHCPSPCPRGGIIPTGVSLHRTNYGLPDNDNNGQPDATGSIDYTKVSTKRVMHGDTLEVQYRGTIHYGSESLTNFTTGHVQTTWNGGSGYTDLVPISARVAIYNSAGVLIGSQSGLPFEEPSSTTAKINYSIAYLSSFPSSYTRYNQGDSVVVTATYRAVQPTIAIGALSLLDFTSVNEMFVGNTMASAIPEEEKYMCDVTGGSFKFATMNMAQNGSVSRNHTGCDSVTIVSDNHIGLGQDYHATETFTHEYRPIAVFNTVKVKIPSGYTFSSATALEYYSNGEVTFASRSANIIPIATVGDTLVFDIKSLYQPYGGAWFIPDEGRASVYNVSLKASCETSAGLSNFTFIKSQLPAPGSGYTTLPFSVADYAIATSNNISYSKPNLITSSPESAITVNNPEAVWELQVAQTVSGQTANNVWLAKQNGIGTVTITSVERLTASGGTVVETITPSSGGIYQLGDYAGVGNKFYKVTASYVNCVKDSVMISTGWGCDGYPANEAAAACKEQVKLTVTPQDANLQLTILNQPSNAPIDLCADLNYEILVKSVALGIADDPRVRVLLPGSAGLSYKSGTYELFTSTAGGYIPVADAEVVPNATGTILTFNIPDALLASMPSLDTFKVKFTLNTSGSCSWISGGALRFTANAFKPCGTPTGATIMTSNPINLEGAVYDDLNSYSITSTIGDVNVTSAYSPAAYRFKLVNEGTTPSAAGQKISVEIPSPLQLNVGTVVNVKNHTPVPINVTVNAAGNTVYTWNLTAGVAPMDSIVFTADVFANGAVPDLECGAEMTINEFVTQEFTATCAANPSISCTSMQEVASHESDPFTVNRPIYTLSGLSAGISGTNVSGSFTVTNMNAVHSSQTAILSLYKDENGNGLYDAGETLIGTDDIALTTATTQTHTYVINPSVAGPFAPVVAVLSATYACDTPQTSVLTVLPVELISFTAKAVGNVAKLDWQTGTEINNKGFYIERSIDNLTWETLGFVATKAENGNSSNALYYSYVDQLPNGDKFYRLRQTDMDGKIKYSPIRKVVFDNGTEEVEVKIYPNPASQLVTIEADKVKEILLFDVTGRLLEIPATLNGVISHLDVSNLPSGNYMIQIVNNNGRSSHHKLTITKQ